MRERFHYFNLLQLVMRHELFSRSKIVLVIHGPARGLKRHKLAYRVGNSRLNVGRVDKIRRQKCAIDLGSKLTTRWARYVKGLVIPERCPGFWESSRLQRALRPVFSVKFSPRHARQRRLIGA